MERRPTLFALLGVYGVFWLIVRSVTLSKQGHAGWCAPDSPPDPPLDLSAPLEAHDKGLCTRTQFLPFQVGCPASCVKRRPDLETKTKVYRLATTWYFGPKDGSWRTNASRTHPGAQRSGLRHSFLSAEQDLRRNVAEVPELLLKPQKAMHLSLHYLCCLTAEEASKAKALLPGWFAEQSFSTALNFHRLECWHERHSSITTIIVADDASQRRLLKLNQEANAFLASHGVPTTVQRSEQMPFHITLAGLYRPLEHLDIRPFLPRVGEWVADISSRTGAWAGESGFELTGSGLRPSSLATKMLPGMAVHIQESS